MDYKFTEDWFSENNPEKVVRQFLRLDLSRGCQLYGC